MMDLELDGRVAIVTGASRGLGRAAALALVEQGVRVVAAARSIGDLDELMSTAPDQIHSIQCDMLDAGAVAALPEVAIERFGGLDIIVNNAGIAPAGKFLEQDAT
ncbi:MAG: SDR family NAD(P)-dependent oxidoreductase, partial [Sphingomonadales bacterium]